MNLDLANLTNLTSLWQQYGAHMLLLPHGEHIHLNHSWPYRCWMVQGTKVPEQFDDWLSSLPARVVLPVYMGSRTIPENPLFTINDEQSAILSSLGWQCAMEQTAMYLNDEGMQQVLKEKATLSIKTVSQIEELMLWVNISSSAFAYQIDHAVIQGLMNEPMVELVLGIKNRTAVCCALLYKTGEIVGLHQMSVLPEWQGQGLAQQLMVKLVEKAMTWQTKAIVLQSSKAGFPLYKKLGFTQQFQIKNYQQQTI